MSITVALAGDTMLGRGVGDELATAGPEDLFCGEIRDAFAAADLVVLNLECCISDRGEPWGGLAKAFHFRAPPRAAQILAELGVDIVNLANNHALDFGYEALADTLESLERTGIGSTGAGGDLAAAREPARYAADGLTVAVTSFTDHPADFAATPGRPGVAHADLSGGLPPWLGRQVTDVAARADVTIVTPHWGPNMTTGPPGYVRSAAGQLTRAGATLVAGHSAHVFHGVAGPVLYDLGDFIDDYAIDPVLRNDLGLLFLVTVDRAGPELIRALPLKLEYARTGLAAGADLDWTRSRLARACSDVGTAAVRQDGDWLVVEEKEQPPAGPAGRQDSRGGPSLPLIP